MFRFLLYIFIFYLAYQFIFSFLVPIYKTTQHVRKGFREMSDRMNHSNEHDEDRHDAGQSSQRTPSKNSSDNKTAGEYIDFEEVK